MGAATKIKSKKEKKRAQSKVARRDWLDEWAADVAAKNGRTYMGPNAEIGSRWTDEELAIMMALRERRTRTAKEA